MEINLLAAINNIVNNPITDIITHYKTTKRFNKVEKAIELYIQDIFCNANNFDSVFDKWEIFSKYFAFFGNFRRFPNIIIKNGDGILFKTITETNAPIKLNSFYPRDKLYKQDSIMAKHSIEGEDWQEKDLLYIIIELNNQCLKSIWFLYGDCFIADKEIYEYIQNRVKQGLEEAYDVEVCIDNPNELGTVEHIDPLDITSLQIKGSWFIENPNLVFEDYIDPNIQSKFSVHAVMLKTKYDGFPIAQRKNLEKLQDKDKNFNIKDVKIRWPNNTVKLLEAKFISFYKY